MEWEAKERKSATIHGASGQSGFFDYAVMTKDKTSDCYFWTTDTPREEGLYRVFHRNEKGIFQSGDWESWEEISKSGEYFCVSVSDDLETLDEYIETETKDGYRVYWLGPIPVPQPPKFS